MKKSSEHTSALKDYSKFCPKNYYQEYYSKIGEENLFLLKFFHEFYKDISTESRVLEFGGGPTIYQILSAGRKVKEIIFAEYLEVNRREIGSWIEKKPEALNWDQYISQVLKLNSKEDSEINKEKLRDSVSSKITEIIECDAYLPNMLINRTVDKFDVVSSNFCLECINGEENIFIEFMEKIAQLVEKQGKIALTMLKNSSSYQISDLSFPALPVDEYFMKSLLGSMNFSEIEISSLEAEKDQGYEGLIAISAKKL